jgi:hypothetical protein
MSMESNGWRLMYDGVLWIMGNRQGGPSGGSQVRVPNWGAVMVGHPLGPGRLTGAWMFSLDPATVGPRGYAEIFQAGETYKGAPLVDRQHPHDLTMQLAASWRVVVGGRTGVTVAGGPVGEPALGPVAFMHRPSAGENPVAPLSHHTFDSTHIAMGVITAAVDRGPLILEASLFNGREPNENRWNLLDRGPLDSWSARLWVHPVPAWMFQVSTGLLKQPEALEPGNIRRTTASAAWLEERKTGYAAFSAGYGRNDTVRGAFTAFFAEATLRAGANTGYTRFEAVQVESRLFLSDLALPDQTGADVLRSRVLALTIGGVRDFHAPHRIELGIGAAATTYGVPDILRASHGTHPWSFHVFLRIRPPRPAMGRMWNMTMTGLLSPARTMAMPMSMK